MQLTHVALAGLTIALLSACNFDFVGNDTYTLYRGNVATGNLRIHVATFDSAESLADNGKEKRSYNYTNCARAAKLLQEQFQIVGSRYWCEKGSYKK
jgi:hypothetical protein